MKKVICLCLLFVLFVPTIVLADAAGPSVIGYEAVVINKKGAKSEGGDDDYTVPYNKKIYVYNEDDDTVYACLDGKSQYDCEKSVALKKSDIAPVKKEVTPKDFKTSKEDEVYIATDEIKFLISEKKGAKLKKGPADLYGTYDKTIPYKEVLTSKNYVKSYGPGGSDYILFFYVDSNGYKGWVSPDDVAIYYNEKAIAFKDTKIYDDDNNVIDTIKTETIINDYYGSFYGGVFINYNGKMGHAKDVSFAYESKKGRIVTIKKAEIMSLSGEKRGEIPAGESLKILFASSDDDYGDYPYHNTSGYYMNENDKESYFYVEYDGIKGIVSSNDVISLDYEFKEKTIELKEETKFYDLNQPEGKDEESMEDYLSRWKTIGKIPKSAKVTVYTEHEDYDGSIGKSLYIQLAKYKGKLGYITRIEISENEPSDDPEPTTEPLPTATNEPVNPNNNSNNGKEKNDNIILYCIIGAVLLAITVIGIIIVINKKKKKEKVEKESKEEIKQTEQDDEKNKE